MNKTTDGPVNPRRKRQDRSRKFLWVAFTVAFVSAVISVSAAFVVYEAVHSSAQQGVTLAQQVKDACADPYRRPSSMDELCGKAEKVITEAPNTVRNNTSPRGEPLGPVTSTSPQELWSSTESQPNALPTRTRGTA